LFLQVTVLAVVDTAIASAVEHADPILTAAAALDTGVAASSEPATKTANSAACDFLAREDVEKFIRTLLYCLLRSSAHQ
jgi:hypothetical protein